MNLIFTIIADGQKVGITTANSEFLALRQAIRGLSRPTQSKESESCDYAHVGVVPFITKSVPATSVTSELPLLRVA